MKVRTSAWAGQFYPGDPGELAGTVDALLAEAPSPALEGPAVAALSPHAGYDYSGRSAAKVYKALQGGAYDLVVVVGTHYPDEEGLFLSPYDLYRTPLGEIPLALEAAKRLKAEAPETAYSARAHSDHSVEVQLPFLQRTLGGFELLPVVANLRTPEAARRAGEALAAAVQGRKAVLIASSDLSHFPDHATGRKVDPASMDAFMTLDPDYLFLADRLLMEHEAPGLRCAWCGLGGAAAVLCAAKRLGAGRARLLECTDSHEAGGEEGRTVGYGAALLLKGGGPPPWPTLELSEEEGRDLVALAHRSLEESLRTGRPCARRLYDRPRFNLPAAVFVTWEEGDWKQGGLRGCIGTVEARETLGDAVARCAVLSARDDPRFPPVTLEELPRLRAEISVLSAFRPIRPAEVRAGLGVQVRRGPREGLFLPQVWEKLPTVEEFMSTLCRQKAGLPAEAWRERGTELRGFTARCYR